MSTRPDRPGADPRTRTTGALQAAATPTACCRLVASATEAHQPVSSQVVAGAMQAFIRETERLEAGAQPSGDLLEQSFRRPSPPTAPALPESPAEVRAVKADPAAPPAEEAARTWRPLAWRVAGGLGLALAAGALLWS